MSLRRPTTLQVLMNGLPVGLLRNSARGVLSFTYASTWLVFGGRRPLSLSLPLATREYAGPVVENYFDNLLPDSQPLRSRLQIRVGAESGRCFDLLARIGRDCIGALQLVPEGETVRSRQIDRQRLAMAMAVHGKNRHYHLKTISRRHWLENARRCRFSPETMALIIDEACDRLADIIDRVAGELPRGFPEDMAASIFSGLRGARERLVEVAPLNGLTAKRRG